MEWCQCELCEGVEGGTVSVCEGVKGRTVSMCEGVEGGTVSVGEGGGVQLGILFKNTVALNDH